VWPPGRCGGWANLNVGLESGLGTQAGLSTLIDANSNVTSAERSLQFTDKRILAVGKLDVNAVLDRTVDGHLKSNGQDV